MIKVHMHGLEVGDLFKLAPDGPTFRRVAGPDDRVWISDATGEWPVMRLEYHRGPFVIRVPQPQPLTSEAQ